MTSGVSAQLQNQQKEHANVVIERIVKEVRELQLQLQSQSQSQSQSQVHAYTSTTKPSQKWQVHDTHVQELTLSHKQVLSTSLHLHTAGLEREAQLKWAHSRTTLQHEQSSSPLQTKGLLPSSNIDIINDANIGRTIEHATPTTSPHTEAEYTLILTRIHERARLYDQALFEYKRWWRNGNVQENGNTIECGHAIQQLKRLSSSVMEAVLIELRLLKSIGQNVKFDEIVSGCAAAIRLTAIILHDKRLTPPIHLAIQFYQDALELLHNANSSIKLIATIYWLFAEHHFYVGCLDDSTSSLTKSATSPSTSSSIITTPFAPFLNQFLSITVENLRYTPYSYIVVLEGLRAIVNIANVHMPATTVFSSSMMNQYASFLFPYLFRPAGLFDYTSCLPYAEDTKHNNGIAFLSISEASRNREIGLSSTMWNLPSPTTELFRACPTQKCISLYLDSIYLDLMAKESDVRYLGARVLKIVIMRFHNQMFSGVAVPTSMNNPVSLERVLDCSTQLFSDSLLEIRSFAWAEIWPMVLRMFDYHKLLMSKRIVKLLLAPLLHTLRMPNRQASSVDEFILRFWRSALQVYHPHLHTSICQSILDEIYTTCGQQNSNHLLCKEIMLSIEKERQMRVF